MKKNPNGWTPERRAKQAKAIKDWQPWKQSTGPRTPEGKAAVAQNAYTHGFCSEDMQEINDLLAAMRAFAKAVIASSRRSLLQAEADRQKAQNMLNYLSHNIENE